MKNRFFYYLDNYNKNVVIRISYEKTNNYVLLNNPFLLNFDDLEKMYLSTSLIDFKKGDFLYLQYLPKKGYRLDDIDNYEIKIFNKKPEWYNETAKETILKKLQEHIKLAIVSNDKELIFNRGIILTNGAHIDTVKRAIVYGMYDNSSINYATQNTTICNMFDNSQINIVDENSIIYEMRNYSLIKYISEASKVFKMRDYSKIKKMLMNSEVSILKGKSSIDKMIDESNAFSLNHFAIVGEMYDNSAIEEMWDWAIVGSMHDNSKINYMDDESKVKAMFDKSEINSMFGNAMVEHQYDNTLVKKINDDAKILEKNLKLNSKKFPNL